MYNYVIIKQIYCPCPMSSLWEHRLHLLLRHFYFDANRLLYMQARGAQPFWAKGRSVLFLVHSRAEDKIISWTFESRLWKNQNLIKFYTSFLISYGLILLPSELFWIVIHVSCKIANSSMKFKSIHKISAIQKTFLVFFKPAPRAG